MVDKILDSVTIWLWSLMALLNLVSFFVLYFTGNDTGQTAAWFAVSVIFIRLWVIDRDIEGLR